MMTPSRSQRQSQSSRKSYTLNGRAFLSALYCWSQANPEQSHLSVVVSKTYDYNLYDWELVNSLPVREKTQLEATF